MSISAKRMWVNQPSTLQTYHKLHGLRVLAIPEYEGTYRIYFLNGDLISQQISPSALSDGWPQQNPVKAKERPNDWALDAAAECAYYFNFHEGYPEWEGIIESLSETITRKAKGRAW